MRIDQVLAAVDLPDSGSPRLDAELLLAAVLDKSRSYLRTWPEYELTAPQLNLYRTLLARRRAGEPVAYLLGRQGFWSLDLAVAPSTLIPRPDTERLVELALELGPTGAARVLDLGTGSGAIALALASERPQWQLTGVDRVTDAVALATRNAEELGLRNVSFQRSDWFAGVSGQRFDLVVSNPPYIASDDPHLSQGDVRFEPSSALVSGNDGLQDVRQIIGESRKHLQGWLLLEHGWQQAAAVQALLHEQGYQAVASWQDLAGQTRVTGGQWHG
ncbi:peptide chain release factor N(5)-glutamine methyltransferase [Halopseudomonas salegens]|uniref:Release factor glutamine methyltransferase n=1 Tax=Halopseudomonas salegens TaxID=1434072 RepID=A0A1H2GMI1_9GAMM|nr:peptide chain release factor N(5)-glutamine methyltransferase [Halopseudomonas salegens]SDU20765.1 [protein release factor]-glutamine N5-methyltransferase [Halopseudomonas salegens]